ncbi:MAG: DevR family CRISPR-associated autoregulator [Aggregatilineaceae bacterium]
MTTPLYSLSISARAILDMHSLNNEGGEGNQIQTRMVNIVDQYGQLQNVNAISGDMFKHIQAEHLFHIAREHPDLPLCAGCREFNANRINADGKFIADTKGLSDAETLDVMLQTCAMDDIEGILITEGGRSVPRKSVIEFGWVVGVPERVETDSYFHVKYATERGGEQRAADREAVETGANLGQAIFHRPASSGIYAAVCHVELARIGFNDITQQYAISEEQRALRAQALLQSVLYTFLQPNGAMRSAQAPHLVDFSGVLTLSSGPVPAPTVSPLKEDYREQIARVRDALERIAAGTVSMATFDSLGDFTDLIGELLQNTVPYELRYA